MVSLNPIMVDGTGMCGACRVSVGGVTRFGCVDGPEFDGHLVNFDELIQRQRAYLVEEKRSMDHFQSCGCKA
jgi:ferredoxin--NADP+ reductase